MADSADFSLGRFISFSPAGESEVTSDDEFPRILWESLPKDVQEKLIDEDQVDIYLHKIDTTLKEHGLILHAVNLDVQPNGEAIWTLKATFDK